MNDPATLELLGRPPSGKAVVRMTPKGHPLVDLDTAEPATSSSVTSRRGLLGALGAAGFSANGRNDEVFDELQVQFAISNVEDFTRAAWELENALVATHTELMDRYESDDARTLTASIVVVEARMGVVLADLGGFSGNLDRLTDPPGDAFDLSGGDV